MRDGTTDTPESAVAQVAALAPGESYARARFIPRVHVTPDRIRTTKQRLLSALTPVIARAKEIAIRRKVSADYRIHSFHELTRDCDVVVAAVIVRKEDELDL
jgi:hypothetical protein